LLGLGEQAQGIGRLVSPEDDGRRPGLHPAVCRGDRFGAGEEADRRIEVIQPQRRIACRDQRLQRLRVPREGLQRIGQTRGSGVGERLDHRLCRRRLREHLRNQRAKRQQQRRRDGAPLRPPPGPMLGERKHRVRLLRSG
jgi:hypothetical protein